jgi:hypothetical protein
MFHLFTNSFETYVIKKHKTKSIEELSNERSVHSCSPNWVIQNGSPLIKELTLEALKLQKHNYKLPKDLYLVIDTRVQRLMPGMYPSIPGWHCDAVPRSGYYSQPDLTKIHPNAVHFVTTISTHPEGVSNTLYMSTPLNIEFTQDQPIWKQAHRAVINSKENINTQFYTGLDGTFVVMSSNTLHTAQPTVNRGWRLFYRMSMMPTPPTNDGKFVDQQQVYLLSEENGW